MVRKGIGAVAVTIIYYFISTKTKIRIFIRIVFATSTPVTATFSALFNWLTGVDPKYKPLYDEITFWCVKP